MHDGKIINNKLVSIRLSLTDIFFKFFGFNIFTKNLLLKRCEVLVNVQFNIYLLSQWFVFLNFFLRIIPKNSHVKKR
jgi:hypothetical protein